MVKVVKAVVLVLFVTVVCLGVYLYSALSSLETWTMTGVVVKCDNDRTYVLLGDFQDNAVIVDDTVRPPKGDSDFVTNDPFYLS